VRKSFDAFFTHCEALVPSGRQAELRAAREEFLKELD
jgi:hypothetical protein